MDSPDLQKDEIAKKPPRPKRDKVKKLEDERESLYLRFREIEQLLAHENKLDQIIESVRNDILLQNELLIELQNADIIDMQ